MGKIDRLKRITMARIEAFLATLEKPEYLLPRLLEEMKTQVAEARNAQAKARSAVNGAYRRLDEVNGKILRLKRGAELAVRADDIETARQAIAAQIEAEHRVQTHQAELETAEKAYHAAAEVCTQLAANLESLKEKKKQMLRQYHQQQLTKQLQEKYTQSVMGTDNDILDAVSRMEAKIEQQQIELEAHTELAATLGSGLDEKHLEKRIQDAEVDRRLNELQTQIHQDKP